MQRESMEFDVIIVGAGPSGLSTAISYAQLCKAQNQTPNICVLEKGSEVGAHILSGAVIDPKALFELLPDAKKLGAPLNVPVLKDAFFYLTNNKARKLPTPPQMKNHGNFIVSLGEYCQFLAQVAENLGVEIFPGFAADHLLFNEQDEVIGVGTGDMGLDKQGQHKPSFQPGMDLKAKYTVFAEGCRGHLSKQLMAKYHLQPKMAQTYGIGIKELWEVDSPLYRQGTVHHTIGWPLDKKTYGGSFVYHLDQNKVAIGFVIGLDYQNPYLNPYEEFQRFKHHPHIQPLLENGKVLSYGARALNEGGFQSIPTCHFPGGLIIGCSAGFLNVPKIKGSHTAMKSGMLAAETVFEQLKSEQPKPNLTEFQQALKKSWIHKELKKVRNVRPSFKWGLWPGLIYSALDTYVFYGHAPWTLKHHIDHQSLKKASNAQKINYPKPDGIISFDRLTSVSRANVYHEEDQPCHLTLKNSDIPIKVNLEEYASPETRYCPAGVYEIVEKEGNPYLQINAQNCIHCKTCDIKDPKQNINWIAPEGGGGPNYSGM